MNPPNYFRRVEEAAQKNWDLLASSQELAGPWHQLFRQVQSPRHVVSELLQNADDAGAKSATIRIEENTFIFEHNGNDFDAEQFASICRFGFSNKRTLHTIGFRGVGFKSIFSIGDTVEVYTPTLAVCFEKNRFTQPVWMDGASPTQQTVIRVRIANKSRAAAIRKNFEEWSQSPASLLFFNRLRELTIGGQVIKREPFGKGPVQDSAMVRLIGKETENLLILRSGAVRFPDEAIEEIRSERGIGEEELNLPPCRVEIVLGLSGAKRLYVVLPTGAELVLPFSCNAPFVQDPARFAIKDPAISPTNRWLLERAGQLAGSAMIQWLGNDSLSLVERAKAYNLLKEAEEFQPGLEGTCSRIIMESMLLELRNQKLILTTKGSVLNSGDCVSVPANLFNVWEPESLVKIFASDSNSLVACEVGGSACSALRSHGWLNEVSSEDTLRRLSANENVPRPVTWPQLHALWTFVQNEVLHDGTNEGRRQMKIVPVDGSKILHAAKDVVRLSSRRDLLSSDDWKFVMDYAPTMDAKWLEWISERAPKRALAWNEKGDLGHSLLRVLGLHEPSQVDRIAAQASLRIFTGKNVDLADCVRAAHIMAALGASVPEGFRFVTKDLNLRGSSECIVADETGRLEDMVSKSWAREHLLHEDYFRNFSSCTADSWKIWVKTPGCGIWLFSPIIKQEDSLDNRHSVSRFAKGRGASEPKEFKYRRDDFTVVDFGLPLELTTYWEKLAKSDTAIWSGVLEGILTAPVHHWKDKTKTEIRQNGRNYSESLDCGFIPAKWIHHFRSLTCLPDSHGKLHTPAELFLRTPDTEPLMGVEPFVRAELDSEATRPLLKLLGVRDTPTGTDKLLQRLHALSGTTQPTRILAQISRLYEALDRIVLRSTSVEVKLIAENFGQKAIILTDSGEWMTSGEVSVFPDEDCVSPTIHSSLRTLVLWARIGVSERPALERTIEWLKSLPSGTKLDAAAAKRVRTALQRDPIRIWNECQHWMSLDSTWEQVSMLKYRLTMQDLMKWGDLFPSIKTATANLKMLNVEVTQLHPFVGIRKLGEVLEFHVTRLLESPENCEERGWMAVLAEGLCRVVCSNNEDTQRVRMAAQRLRQAAWRSFNQLDVTPYIEGTPAGEPFTPKVVWQDLNLYVAAQPTVRLYKELTDELSRPFSHPQVSEAVAACIDRSPEFVAEYLAANFEMGAQVELLPLKPTTSTNETIKLGDSSENTPETVPVEQPAAVGEAAPPTAKDGELADTQIPIPETRYRPSKPAQMPRPSLIEDYALKQGFRWNPARRCFLHASGRWIGKSETPFNWEEHRSDGSLLRRFWVTDQKLTSGVEIEAELWAHFGREPAATTLVVVGTENSVSALNGQDLLRLKDKGYLKLFPARYRLVESAVE